MVELSLIASAALSPTNFCQEQGLCRAYKEFQALSPLKGKRPEIWKPGSLQLGAQNFENLGQSMHLWPECSKSVMPDPTAKYPVLTDVQDCRPDSVLFSFGIAEQCTKREKILKFLTSGSNIAEGGSLNISLLSDLMGLQTVAVELWPQPYVSMHDTFCLYEIGMDDSQHLLHHQRQFCAPEPLLDFVKNLSHTSIITVNSDGQVLFTGSGSELKNILSVAEEFNISKRSTNHDRKSMLVPYFTRKGRGHARPNNQVSSFKLQTGTVDPLKSPENVNLKPLPKKKQNRKAGKERDLYHKNYFHACESLLSVILDKKGKTASLSLKKSGPEITQLLTHFSAGIAGTGLAVLLSVACKMANGRVTFSTTKLLNTSFGFGLFWLSWAVNSLRDTIIHLSKNSSKLKLKEEEVVGKVERSMKDILLRAAALMAVAVLRFV
ncbi:uncharacterized protein [Elaeis guineensis]|uniref:Uncharacterized protein LOC105052714 n=1 Tax=Elaeis guineensis var. tenera TaxID=51953 RepID=A0A6I9RU67_ELAGV|nr:uncharacterized protein LOC105052714 [Elaeis guineensis]